MLFAAATMIIPSFLVLMVREVRELTAEDIQLRHEENQKLAVDAH